MSILTCACIGFLHIWALYWSWARILLWLQCTSVTRSVSSAEASPHMRQVSPSCAYINVLHNWALYLLSVQTGHKACVSRQMKQCLVSWDLHHVSTSTDDVWWAYSLVLALVLCTSERCTGTGHICCWGSSAHQSHGAGLRSVFHHQLMMFSEQNLSITSHHTQQVSPTCACIDVQHICFLHFVPVHIGHKACVSSQMKQWLVSLDLCILFHHQLMMFDEHTQLCLHWSYARLSAVLKLSTSAAVVPVHIIHKVCILSWSCDW